MKMTRKGHVLLTGLPYAATVGVAKTGGRYGSVHSGGEYFLLADGSKWCSYYIAGQGGLERVTEIPEGAEMAPNTHLYFELEDFSDGLSIAKELGKKVRGAVGWSWYIFHPDGHCEKCSGYQAPVGVVSQVEVVE